MVSILQTSIKEKKQRKAFKISESKRRYYKFLKMQSSLLGYMPLYNLPKIHFKNYCLVSGRSRSVYSKKFRMSRHQIKKYFSYIKGLRNSSW
jgi:ribosomal protein S14